MALAAGTQKPPASFASERSARISSGPVERTPLTNFDVVAMCLGFADGAGLAIPSATQRVGHPGDGGRVA